MPWLHHVLSLPDTALLRERGAAPFRNCYPKPDEEVFVGSKLIVLHMAN
jgi:hypothetical protein